MIPFALHSQGNDTAGKVWIPRTDALRKLEQAEMYKVYKEYVDILKTDTSLLNGRIRELQAAMVSLNKSVWSYQRDSATYAKIITLYEGKDSVYKRVIADWEKAFKKEHRKRIWTGIGGVLATAAAFILPLMYK